MGKTSGVASPPASSALQAALTPSAGPFESSTGGSRELATSLEQSCLLPVVVWCCAQSGFPSCLGVAVGN